MNTLSFPLILASGSPRRQMLMKDVGYTFTIDVPNVDETWPEHLTPQEVPQYLAEKKAEAMRDRLTHDVVVAADTVVILGNTILNKPGNREEAIQMLSLLTGKTHTVITGVCILSKEKKVVFDDYTEVTFAPLSRTEIEYYVDHFKPYDKAGSYGAQDWIGLVGVTGIVGSYFNVMGLPIHKVYQHLAHWQS